MVGITNITASSSGRAAAAREFLSRMWHLDNDERPAYGFGYVGPRVKGGAPVRSALFSAEGPGTVRDRLLDPATFLATQIDELRGQLALPGDLVPSVCPAFGVVAIPSSFGCEVLWWDDNLPALRPLPDLEPDRILAIRKPSLTGGELSRVLEYTRFFIDESGGQLPIRVTDIQGPLDSAALVVGHTQFLSLMLTHPMVAHHLLRVVTEITIDLVHAQRELSRSRNVEFVPSMFQPWLPDGLGISVSNDECVMISAAMHDTFSVPYINMLSEEFGGVVVHSCGDWTHQFPSLEKIHGLRGLEFGASEAPFRRVLEFFGGQVVLACRVGLHRDTKFGGMKDFVSQVLAAAPTYRGLFVNIDVTNGMIDEQWPETDPEEISSIVESKAPRIHNTKGMA
jgi:hypothetical protein